MILCYFFYDDVCFGAIFLSRAVERGRVEVMAIGRGILTSSRRIEM